MIVPMQKVTILGCAAWQEQLLGAIRDIGVVHILPSDFQNKTINEDELARVKENINLLEEAVGLMPQSSGNIPGRSKADSLGCAKHLLTIHQRRKTLNKEISELEDEYNRLSIWGRFSPERLGILSDKGLLPRFFIAAAHDLDKIPAATIVFQAGRQGHRLLLVTLGLDKAIDGLQEIAPPARGRAAIEISLAEKKKILSADNLEIEALTRYRPALSRCLKEQRERLAFLDAGRAMSHQRDICYLSGFCPRPRLPDLREAAKRQKWGLLIEKPSENDPVPTLIQYSPWSRIFKPVVDFMGVIPGYKEFDCNGPSLFFFIIFFAMLIGDAGYGLLLFIISLFFLYQGRRPKEPFVLLIILASATILWGAFTGTWFGIEGLEHTSVFGRMVLPGLGASAPDSAASVMLICFLIGAVQLTLAHLWLAGRKFPRLVALADIGWAMIMGAIYFIALFLVLNKSMPPLTFLLLSGGVVLIMLFSEQADTFSMGAVAQALARSPLTLLSGINSLSDLISYIRLFAVGLATREVALAVNHMALNVGFETILSSLAAAAILLAGHSLNIVLGAMAILVHGVRLNLLEFSRHLEINWSGIPYTPFGRKEV